MTHDELRRLSHTELDRVFRSLEWKPEPPSRIAGMRGCVLVRSRVVEAFVFRFVWQGKIFWVNTVVNRVSPFRIRAFYGVTYVAPSLLDGQLSLVIDYSQAWITRHVRDEIRFVSDGLWLGRLYVANHPVLYFSLRSQS